MGEGSSNWTKQLAYFAQMSFRYREYESKKKLTANDALTSHILSETTRDQYTLTYADNGI